MTLRNKQPEESCANCGARYTRQIIASGIIIDDYSGNLFCDVDCFEEWADIDRTPVDYYAEMNLREVDEL